MFANARLREPRFQHNNQRMTEMENLLTGAGLILFTLIIGAAIAVLTAFPVMLLWNAVVPGIFGLTTLNFTQALLLSMLCSILFKSMPSSSSK